jgi:hypothetical protein
MFKQRLMAVGVFAMGLTVAGGAFAVDVNFCKSGDSCADGLVKNKAVVVVTKTRIAQQAKHGCGGVDKTVNKNLYKGTTQIKLELNRNCRYTVKFTTTSGCTGDKQGQISRSEIENGKTAAYLENGCGSLKVKIRKYP